jgi:ParB family transcriptional regulator, chromosome partitioning protein
MDQEPRQRRDHFFGTSGAHEKVYELDLGRVVPNPSQPRRIFDEEKLEELAKSIGRVGLLQPIAVQKMADSDSYMIVAGERRFRAHQRLGKGTIRAVIVTGDPEELALIENLQRADLHPLEEAEGLLRLKQSHNYDDGELAEIVGKNRATVNETLRLNDLPEPIKEEARSREIPRIMLLQVARIEKDEERQRFWTDIKEGHITTVRQAKERRKAPKSDGKAAEKVHPLVAAGRNFVTRLEQTNDEDLAANQAVYDQLVQLERQISKHIKALRKAVTGAGKPAAAGGEDETVSTQAAE